MSAIVRQRFNRGFKLTEEEVRRLTDVVMEQVRSANPDSDPEVTVVVELKSGAIVHPRDVDDLLDLENGGNSRIVDVGLTVGSDPNGEHGSESVVEVHFRDPRRTKDDDPIDYRIEGAHRDRER